jgi:hypothetical protein
LFALYQNNALERLNRQLKDVVDNKALALSVLMQELRKWMQSQVSSSTPREHPLVLVPSSKEQLQTELNNLYRTAAKFAVAVEQGRSVILSVPAVLVAAHTQHTLARYERIAAMLKATDAKLTAEIAKETAALAAASAAGAFAFCATQAALCLALDAQLKSAKAELETITACIAAYQAAPIAAPTEVVAVALEQPAIAAAACLLVPADAYYKELADNFSGDNLLRSVKTGAHKWLTPFQRVPLASASTNLQELLDSHDNFYVLERREPWPDCNWSCTCKDYFKHYRCEHMLAVAIAEGTWQPPPRYNDFTALARAQRGRPATAGNRYTRAPAANPP